MKKFHIAISVSDLSSSIEDYSKRLGCDPQIVVPKEFALWRTDILNFSIRKTNEPAGSVRHIGFEDSEVATSTEEKDINGVVWESFNEENQLHEIHKIWPDLMSKNID
jgi:hypothetical protein